jgi:pimeloyl-ACP methyl ester carboxylesterase
VWFHHPWIALRANTIGEPHEIFTRLPRELLFCMHTPDSIVESCAARCEPESLHLYFDSVLRLPRPERVHAPMLVLGGADDGTITNDEVRATAQAYRTQAELFPRMGHNLMLEPGWQAVAERIEGWLDERGL